VAVLALTDHDTTEGITEAQRAGEGLGIQVVAGVEVSVTWQARTVHIVGLNVDPRSTALEEGLASLRTFRGWRAEEIGRRLAKHGIEGAYEGARRLAGGTIVSRTHFARYIAAQVRAKSIHDVFRHFLVRNKPGHVPGQWADLEDAVSWIRHAGGQAVVAHPARYRLTGTRLQTLLGEFREYGGEGIEVVSGSHTPDDCRTMAGQAGEHKLRASAGSDYHGPENPWIELGRLPALPKSCTPIWADWRH
jgi:predicted metal-dependent phosphoesterase TrpH